MNKLIASDGEPNDFFVFSVSIDGDYAIAGAYEEDENGSDGRGAAYIFERSGNNWTQQAKLTASNRQNGNEFGRSVSIDSDYAIVGANVEDEKGLNAGSAFIFVRAGTAWTQQAKLTASDGEVIDVFGWSVSIDGDYAIVGAYGEDEKAGNAGAAYIYKSGIDKDGNPTNELQSWSTLPRIPSGFADNIDNVGNLGNHTATTNLQMNNQNLLGVNNLAINDARPNEGISWVNTTSKIYVSPLDNSNFSDGFLRIINGSSAFGISLEAEGVTLIDNGPILVLDVNEATSSIYGTSMYKQLGIAHPENSGYSWWIGHQAESPSSSDDDLYFYVDKSGTRKTAGFIQDNISTSTGTQMNFTGQHRTLVNGINFNNPESEIESLEGLIVVADQNEYLSMSGGLKSGQEAILIDESLPIVSISSKIKDKRVFGVISSMEPENSHDAAGAFATPYHKEAGDQRMYINATGEGAIWVVDQGGSMESGDYIMTASVPGYGMKQEDDILHNYTVAKITMDVNFEPRLVPKRQIKKTEQMVDGEKSLINVLDAYGRIIWEPMISSDGSPVMEYEYKVRYLKADGTEIDRKSFEQMKCDGEEVYRAAFVGCTYHSG